MSPRGGGGGGGIGDLKLLRERLNEDGIKLAFTLSSTKPITTRVHLCAQQLMLSKTSNYVIARYRLEARRLSQCKVHK